MVEAAGVEREKREIGNLLMARHFWGYRVLSAAFAAVRRVHRRPRETPEIDSNFGGILEAAGQWSRRLPFCDKGIGLAEHESRPNDIASVEQSRGLRAIDRTPRKLKHAGARERRYA